MCIAGAAGEGERGEFVDAILPIGGSPEEAEDDEFGVAHRLVEPEINREVVGEAEEIGEAQA
jgi:hypothetical protein